MFVGALNKPNLKAHGESPTPHPNQSGNRYNITVSSRWNVTALMVQITRLPSCHAELRSSVKVEVAVLGSPSLTVLMVSVDVKQH